MNPNTKKRVTPIKGLLFFLIAAQGLKTRRELQQLLQPLNLQGV